MVRGINHAKANEGKAWIVDSHRAKGVFSTEIQEYIASDVFPRFAEIGIKYFIPISLHLSLSSSRTDAVTTTVFTGITFSVTYL
ncbi:hypothetical protein LCGC14_2608040, partial [marine sediment metagenome]